MSRTHHTRGMGRFNSKKLAHGVGFTHRDRREKFSVSLEFGLCWDDMDIGLCWDGMDDDEVTASMFWRFALEDGLADPSFLTPWALTATLPAIAGVVLEFGR